MRIPFAFWGQAESDLPIVAGLKVLSTDLTEAELQFTLVDSGKNEPVYAYGIVYSKTDPNVTLDSPGAQVSTIGTNFPGTLPVTNTHTVTGLDPTSTYYFRVFATNNEDNIPPETIAENTFYSNTATGETKWDAFTYEYNYDYVASNTTNDTIGLARTFSGSSESTYSVIEDVPGTNDQSVVVDMTTGHQALKIKIEDESTGALIKQFTYENSGGQRTIELKKADVPAGTGKILVYIAHDSSIDNTTFDNIRFADCEACFAAVRIRRWGPAKWKVWNFMFVGSSVGGFPDPANNPANNDPGIGNPADTPDLSECTSMLAAFRYNQQAWSGDYPNEQKLGDWDLRSVLTVREMFKDSNVCGLTATKTSKPLQDANWDSCRDFYRCFHNGFQATPSNANKNLWISGWTFSADESVSLANFMSLAFADGPTDDGDIGCGSWDVSNVINMRSIFADSTEINMNLGSWNTSAVRTARFAFQNVRAMNFNGSSWDLAGVVDGQCTNMFSGTNSWSLPKPPLPNCDTSN